MCKKIMSSLVAMTAIMLLWTTNGFSFNSFGNNVNSACAPATPYTGDCLLCHTSGSKGEGTPAQTAYNAGGSTLTDFFCPPEPPICTDRDNDNFSVEGGDCGPVDCNDNDASVNPSATENCSNGIDEDCSGSDNVDPTLLDNDGDGFTVAAGDCNDNNPAIHPDAFDIPNNGIDENCDGVDAVDTTMLDNDGDNYTPAQGDCDDTNAAINPDAVELCTDGLDNNCNGLIDQLDADAVDCPVSCFDNDGDGYSIDGGSCGPIDCNDNDASINPGAEEICDDLIDNDCDGQFDEGCDATCPDADNDGYQDSSCGGADCNDNDPMINPESEEICGNDIDENCNGSRDDVCQTCPDGSLLVIKKIKLDDRKLVVKGRATKGTTITIEDIETGKILADNIKVKRGKWKARMKKIDKSLKGINVISSNGCTVEQQFERNDDEDDDEDDNEDREEEENEEEDEEDDDEDDD